MSRDIRDLENKFRYKVKELLANCRKLGYELKPYCTTRNVYEQARYYRQSRTWKEIKKTINFFKSEKALFLAEVIESVGPQDGIWVTNAPPGLSWHQWGEAIDCFVLEDNQAIWRSDHKGYWIYHREALKLGLHSGYGYGDRVHVQKRTGKITYHWSLREIDRLMEKRFNKNNT